MPLAATSFAESQVPTSPTTLSVCEPLRAVDGDARPVGWLRAELEAQKAPILVGSQQGAAHNWQHIHAGNLLEKLDKDTMVSLFISPDGVLGYYNPANVAVTLRDGRVWGRALKPEILPQFDELELPHLQLLVSPSLQVYNTILQNKKPGEFVFNPNERIYMRTGNVLAQVASSMPAAVPQDTVMCRQVCLYVSHTGTVTNLHWDLDSGVIHQLKGRKRVIVFPPHTMRLFDMYPLNHIFGRRSRFSGKLTEATFDKHPALRAARGFECVIEPDQWLYIPAGWLHHVETLDEDTISLITRFNR